ncbi:glutamine amidotransferase-like class 1 domain-containing protein 3, mitochondrial [Glandiceps talaboti]
MLSTTFAVRSLLAPLTARMSASQRSCHHHKEGSKVAVVLSGCGVYDGAEIHEASAVLVHLSRGGADTAIFAPDIPQMHVIDHTKGEPMEGQSRNVLVESARIARGKVSALTDLKASDYDAVVFPGGFGAAKNLCTFAVDGAKCSINVDVERVLKEFHADKKPIGLCCIAPVLAAKVIEGCELTVGQDKEEEGKWPHAGTAGAVEELGAKHVNKDVTESHIDEKNNIVTTPAYMCNTQLHNIFDGIGKMVSDVLHRVK